MRSIRDLSQESEREGAQAPPAIPHYPPCPTASLGPLGSRPLEARASGGAAAGPAVRELDPLHQLETDAALDRRCRKQRRAVGDDLLAGLVGRESVLLEDARRGARGAGRRKRNSHGLPREPLHGLVSSPAIGLLAKSCAARDDDHACRR